MVEHPKGAHARQDRARLRDSVGSLRRELQWLYLSSPARLGREEVKEKRGVGNWEQRRVSKASWTAIGAAGQVVHLQFQSSLILACQVFDKMSARN
jgi:hypothetical protein